MASWDKHVYLYDTHSGEGEVSGARLNTYEHRAPVLDVCFGANDNEAYTACMDWQVYKYDCIPRLLLRSVGLTSTQD